MRFLVDESAGSTLVGYLRQSGHDVLSVAEAMPGAPDEEGLARAVREGRILVTNDKDFGTLVFRGGWAPAGVLLLRLQDERPARRVQVLASVLEHFGDRLAGHFIVATERGVRVRPLKGAR